MLPNANQFKKMRSVLLKTNMLYRNHEAVVLGEEKTQEIPTQMKNISIENGIYHSHSGTLKLFCSYIKAYIPMQIETTCVGPSHWFRPPMQPFCVGDTNILVSKKPTRSLADPTPSLVDPTSSLADPTRASGI